jgi:hypothetical protein
MLLVTVPEFTNRINLSNLNHRQKPGSWKLRVISVLKWLQRARASVSAVFRRRVP